VPDITVRENGPYVVTDAPVERRRIVASEHGEPMSWETTATLDAPSTVLLCRCGGSSTKPFCDGTHASNGFTADDVASGTYAERSKAIGDGIRDDRSICEHAGFCTNRVTNAWKLAKLDDDAARAEVLGMIERCPSGALTAAVEPLLPMAIGVVADGPLAVTGGIPITTADGTTLETRNRVTLCRCGHSANKPLCDGAHQEAGFRDP
jgi:CDGSH-type Zn-finger protein